jgi:class 3 adenylate cyclase
MRIGLAAGAVLLQDHAIIGVVINIAARVCSLAQGGKILVSESVLRLGLGTKVRVTKRAIAQLRGFSEPVHLYEVRRRKKSSK